MRISLLSMKYMDEMERRLRESGFATVRVEPNVSLYLLTSNLVDGAAISSVAALALGLEPCFCCPSVVSNGKVRNVVLIFKSKGDSNVIRLKVDKRSFTGRALAFWYLSEQGYEVVEVNDNEDVELLIGDEARRVSGTKVDLGEVWYKEFSLPMVYALFVLRRRIPFPNIRYKWADISVVPLEEVLESLEVLKSLARYWSRPLLMPSGLLGLLLRSLK